ncbi:MAG: BamA/TamA family outer membrane protein [bacterium]
MLRIIVNRFDFLSLIAVIVIFGSGLIIPTEINAQLNVGDYFSAINNSDDDWDWDDDWDDEWYDVDKIKHDIRYNRVEGLYVGININKEYWRKKLPGYPFIFGGLGFAFAEKMFEYQLGLEKGFFDDYYFAFGGELHIQMDTPDRWRMPHWENSLAAFLLREDFYDYYQREGFSGYITQYVTDILKLKASYNVEDYNSTEKNTNWSLFGGKKKFRENPSMNEGELHSLKAELVYDTRNSKGSPTKGWFIQFEGEHAGSALKGDFNFDRFLLDIRRYQPLGFSDAVDFRIRIGSSKGDLPWQKSYHLGGISTLRGYKYKEFPHGPDAIGGNRMVLGQLEYRLGMEDYPEAIGLGLLNNFHLILFVDTGWVDFAETDANFYQGFNHLTWSDIKTDIGFALSNSSGNIRFQIAKRTDIGENDFRFSFRVSRPF